MVSEFNKRMCPKHLLCLAHSKCSVNDSCSFSNARIEWRSGPKCEALSALGRWLLPPTTVNQLWWSESQACSVPAASMLGTAFVRCWVGKPRFCVCLVKPPFFPELGFSYSNGICKSLWPLQGQGTVIAHLSETRANNPGICGGCVCAGHLQKELSGLWPHGACRRNAVLELLISSKRMIFKLFTNIYFLEKSRCGYIICTKV